MTWQYLAPIANFPPDTKLIFIASFDDAWLAKVLTPSGWYAKLYGFRYPLFTLYRTSLLSTVTCCTAWTPWTNLPSEKKRIRDARLKSLGSLHRCQNYSTKINRSNQFLYNDPVHPRQRMCVCVCVCVLWVSEDVPTMFQRELSLRIKLT